MSAKKLHAVMTKPVTIEKRKSLLFVRELRVGSIWHAVTRVVGTDIEICCSTQAFKRGRTERTESLPDGDLCKLCAPHVALVRSLESEGGQ